MNKKFGYIVVAAAVLIAAGCATTPTIDKMFTISRAFGYSSGLVANEIKMDTEVHNGIIEVWNKVAMCVPETNQTFAAAWTPIAQAHTDELVKQGKIDQAQATLIMLGFTTAVTGLDYVFIRYPEAKLYKDLTVAAIDGFTEGFLAVFKPINQSAAAVRLGVGSHGSKENAYLGYDKEAYEYLKAKFIK